MSQKRARILREFQKHNEWARLLRLRELHRELKVSQNQYWRRYAGENYL